MDRKDMEKLWNGTLQNVEKRLNNPRAYDIWIKPVRLSGIKDNTLKLELPNTSFAKGFSSFVDIIKDEFYRVADWSPNVEIIYSDSDAGTNERSGNNLHAFFNLNQSYTFENFIVGPNNRLAHAAAIAVSQSPGIAYNPLFLYGGFGLGKTHLMQAIGQSAHRRDDMKILYIPAEIYVNEFIQSIKSKTTSTFRNKFRNLEFLLLDDIHFIAGKEGTQEEFFHTFNYLYDQRKQIILSSDRPPKEITFLEKRLISRFEWGLVVDLQPPDFETRVAIMRKKCELKNIFIEDEIIFYIAENIKDNIRILEGVLNKIFAYSSLLNKDIDKSMIDEIIHGSYTRKNVIITIDGIIEKVCEYFKVEEKEIKSSKRIKNILIPRQIAMFLCRELTEDSLHSIAIRFGGKDHTTVIHSHRKIKKLSEADEYIMKIVENIKNSLKN